MATKRIPTWLPPILVAGEIVGRIMFFSHVYHTAGNLGSLY